MKSKKILIIKISVIIISLLILSIITLSLLAKKERIGYLSEFKLNIDETLQINGLDINETKQLFTIDNNLYETSITNYIFTNSAITNYSYDFRIKYYSKVFRNSDIYGVYINLDNILNNNDFVKKIKIGEYGSPFGNLESTKNIENQEINNVIYTLKIKPLINVLLIFLVLGLLISIIYLQNKSFIL